MGNWFDTSTGLDLDSLPHFPLTKIRSGSLKDGSRVTFDGISATAGSGDHREVRLRGSGKSGKPWEAHMCCLDEVWRGDLDGNGTQDYVFFASGPFFSGRTGPQYSLSILLMDSDGLPVPFFTTVYQGQDGAGIKHLVDLNHDGHAELLISTYDEIPSDEHVDNFCSGHWVSQLYQFKDFGAQEIRGTIGSMDFPLVHNWTDRGRGCLIEGTPLLHARPAVLHEHGTTTPAHVVTLIRETGGPNGLLRIDPAAGCKAITTNVTVYDRALTREIAFPNLFDTFSSALADKIRGDGARVELRGIDKSMGNGDCSVNLVWAN